MGVHNVSTPDIRRRLVVLLTIGVVGLLAIMSLRNDRTRLDADRWIAYQKHFIDDEGRVVDNGNGRVSHSEGQAYGMLLAIAAGDRLTFDRLWAWTQTHLRVRGDTLFAWQWRPGVTESVPDRNNATDGDVLIAWALLRASRHWNEAIYRTEALAILADIRARLVRQVAGFTVLLPGVEGFDRNGEHVLNLSYWVFPALTEFSQADADPVWARLHTDGQTLLRKARFGDLGLPPDWLSLTSDGRTHPAPGRPARFGFDAVRIPLYLRWGRIVDSDLYQPYRALLDQAGTNIPAWISLTDRQTAPFKMSSGARSALELAREPTDPSTLSNPDAEADYYSASLDLLAGLALMESVP